MADFSTIENNNLDIYLPDVAHSTGWALNADGSATHSSCNDGDMTVTTYTLIVGMKYRWTYKINSISGGLVEASIGSPQTATGFVDESGTATSTQFFFYSNANCNISNFTIEIDSSQVGTFAQNTIAFSEKLNKWTSFYTYISESSFSMFTKNYVAQQGNIYVQESGSDDRCNFYGVQYPATIWFSTNESPTVAKTFLSINYQANQLLTPPPSGVTTSTGQVSELDAANFIQMVLNDGSVFYEAEGLYKAPFVRAYPDLINGNPLKGNYLVMGLETMSPSSVLELFTTEINYVKSYQNIR